MFTENRPMICRRVRRWYTPISFHENESQGPVLVFGRTDHDRSAGVIQHTGVPKSPCSLPQRSIHRRAASSRICSQTSRRSGSSPALLLHWSNQNDALRSWPCAICLRIRRCRRRKWSASRPFMTTPQKRVQPGRRWVSVSLIRFVSSASIVEEMSGRL